MKTTELIAFLKSNDVTKNQGYNLLIEDLWQIGVITKPVFEDQRGESRTITMEDMSRPEAQALIAFFMYQIQEVLLPVIADIRQVLKQVERGGQVFKAELDTQDQVAPTSIVKTDVDVYLNNRINGIWDQIHSDQHDLAINSERVRVGLQEQIDTLKSQGV